MENDEISDNTVTIERKETGFKMLVVLKDVEAVTGLQFGEDKEHPQGVCYVYFMRHQIELQDNDGSIFEALSKALRTWHGDA